MPAERQFDKQAALDKALQAFWTRGYEATSMQELVDCTGVNRASLYGTYGDKRAIFLSALHMYDEARRRMLAGFEARYAPREAIRCLFLSFLVGLNEDGGNRGCFLTNTALELAAHDAEIRAIVATAQQDVEDFFKRMIKKAKAGGEIPDHVKPAEAARGLLASLLGFVVLVRSRPDPALLQGVVSDALRRLD